MTLILKQVFAILKVLNSDTGENQIAAGLACGLILGFAPTLSLQSVLVFILIFIFRIQGGIAFVSAFFFALIAYLIDPVSHQIGVAVLEMDALKGIFTTLYNMPIIPFTKFYNSVVMGSGVLSILLAPIMFFIGKKVVFKYRKVILARFQETKFWKAVKATSFYKWYAKYNEYYG